LCLLDSVVIKNKELAKGEREYDLGIHLQVQEKKTKNLRLLSEISILSMFSQNDAGVGKKVQIIEQAQVLHLC
jgi:hypothetical protein